MITIYNYQGRGLCYDNFAIMRKPNSIMFDRKYNVVLRGPSKTDRSNTGADPRPAPLWDPR